MRIMDLSGKTVKSDLLNKTSILFNKVINIEDLPEGSYLVELVTPQGILAGKFTKR
ncbi:MAG: hypothetical protein ACJA08_000426 [Cyclobacteriaceae bacterium]|jgi:hypothetical protein